MSEKGKTVEQHTHRHTQTHTHRQQCGDYQRVRGGGGGGRHYRGINGDGKRLDMGWSTHDTIYRS